MKWLFRFCLGVIVALWLWYVLLGLYLIFFLYHQFP